VRLQQLYARLGRAGIARPYLRQTVLPSWWRDEAAESPAGYAELILLLCRHLGLDHTSIEDGSAPLRLAHVGPVKLKKAADVEEGELTLASAIATRVAHLAARATSSIEVAVPSSASEVRDRILASGQPWVSLDGLIDYCWSVGVPIIHASAFPARARVMDALAARVRGRPVIVLCKDQRSPACLLYIVAHSLGHVAVRLERNMARRRALRAPDGALVGWRSWVWGGSDLLLSPFAQAAWPGPTLVAAGTRDDIVSGRAGIHACWSPRAAAAHAVGYTAPIVAWGRVRGYGGFAAGPEGWRAERVLVERLYVTPEAEAIAGPRALHERYGVPVSVQALPPVGHLDAEAVLIDDRVERNGLLDDEERAADAFALELLRGHEGHIMSTARWPSAAELADDARRLGGRLGLDPGLFVLECVHAMPTAFHPVAQAALRILEKDADGIALIRSKMEEKLDWSCLPDDSCEFLQRVVRAEPIAP
jgi:hypothetical protein